MIKFKKGGEEGDSFGFNSIKGVEIISMRVFHLSKYVKMFSSAQMD